MMPTRFVVPYPPTLNNAYLTVRGRRVKSEEARRYQQRVRLQACAEGLRAPVSGPVAVIVTVFRPRKSGDLDNTLKVLLDSLTTVAWVDDSQIVELHAFRQDDAANPRAVVSVQELPRSDQRK